MPKIILRPKIHTMHAHAHSTIHFFEWEIMLISYFDVYKTFFRLSWRHVVFLIISPRIYSFGCGIFISLIPVADYLYTYRYREILINADKRVYYWCKHFFFFAFLLRRLVDYCALSQISKCNNTIFMYGSMLQIITFSIVCIRTVYTYNMCMRQDAQWKWSTKIHPFCLQRGESK